MTSSEEAVIHLSDRRITFAEGACTCTEYLRLYDFILPPNTSLSRPIESNHTHIFIPFIGDLLVKKDSVLLEENQAMILGQIEGGFVEIQNPYEADAVNFFELVLSNTHNKEHKIISIDVQAQPNRLLNIFQNVFLGQYSLRQEDSIKTGVENQIFVFVIAGAYEVQNRLLQPRDGLTLCGVKTLEFESLAEESLLLVVMT
ncbi:MAG: hypothetical protein ACK4GN_04015 [Runella sp.]